MVKGLQFTFFHFSLFTQSRKYGFMGKLDPVNNSPVVKGNEHFPGSPLTHNCKVLPIRQPILAHLYMVNQFN